LRRQDCKRLYLYTSSFQAPGFYRKMGYEETGVDEAFPGNDTRHFFRKILTSCRPPARTRHPQNLPP